MGNYLVDRRCRYNGDGSYNGYEPGEYWDGSGGDEPPWAASAPGAPGAFNNISATYSSSYVPNGDHRIEIAKGSGSYYCSAVPGITDPLAKFGWNMHYAQTSGTINLYGNGNAFHGDFDINARGYKWEPSINGSYDGFYYVTAQNGASISDIRVPHCVMSVIDNDYFWTDNANNVDSGYPPDNYNWSWGDHDSLGFDTLYVYTGGVSPNDLDIEIWVEQRNAKIVLVDNATTDLVFHDFVFSGGDPLFELQAPARIDRCKLLNGASALVLVNSTAAADCLVDYNFFVGGHYSVMLDADVNSSLSIYNNTCYKSQALFRAGDAGDMFPNTTVNVKNNLTYKLWACAMIIDTDGSGTKLAALNEDNNHWHIDLDSTKTSSVRYLATNISGDRWWTTSNTHDTPANESTATDLIANSSLNIDPLITPSFGLSGESPCIGAGVVISGIHDQSAVATDIDGNGVYFVPSIGASEPRAKLYFDKDATGTKKGTRSYPYGAFSEYTFTGYNVRKGGILRLKKADDAYAPLDLSGLTDTEAVAVEVEKGAKLTGFTTNGDGYVAGVGSSSSGLSLGLNLGL